MKVAVSIPDDLFRAAEQQAARLVLSRSRLYADALAEYVARLDADAVTAALNAVVDQLAEPEAGFATTAALVGLRSVEWT
jgi:metal-responsive CopG/Arc/MetJ family transcriptional regulator